MVRPLEKRLKLQGARIAVLGAGGAARAAVFGLVAQGAEVFVVNRTHESAVKLARQAKAKSLKHELLAKSSFDVLINATPCGMAGNKQPLPIAESELNASLVFDMVYNPLETPLLKLAKDARHPGHQRRGDVRPARRTPIRNLDRQTRPRSGDDARGGVGAAAARVRA